MRIRIGLAAALMLAFASPGFAADPAVEAPIRTMVEAFNKGDVALAKTTHVPAPMILDEPTAPFSWSGPTAFDDWIAALGKSEADAGKTGGKVALGALTRASVMGDHALHRSALYLYLSAGGTHDARNGHHDIRASQAECNLEDPSVDLVKSGGRAC